MILVTGDRHWTDRELIDIALRRHRMKNEVTIQGGNGYINNRPCNTFDELLAADRGADALAVQVCSSHRWVYQTFWADWGKFGRAAGPIRNRLMLSLAPRVVIAFHDDLKSSRGTKDMLKAATSKGFDCFLWNSKGEELEVEAGNQEIWG